MLFETDNRRESARKRLGAPALVRLGHRILRCSVKDISRTGAMLLFDEEVELPPDFTMSFGERPGTPRFCTVMWQNGRSAGVSFRR
ncbi:PilZ domain-containing protein [Salinarimonas soli]|nr:PilZ domain-containing protein [Salinarimonas soli]